MPNDFCKRVSAAGINPEDNAEEPVPDSSRSNTKTSMLDLRRAMAAVKPQEPPPTMQTGTAGVPSGMDSARTIWGAF